MAVCRKDFFNVEDEYLRNVDLKRCDVEEIRKWMSTQPHLPEIPDNQIALFLNSCYFDVEETKKCLETYFTYKTLYSEFFTGRDPRLPEISRMLKTVGFAALPKRTPSNHRIYWVKLLNDDPKLFDFYNLTRVLSPSVLVSSLINGPEDGHVLVFDSAGFRFAHLVKFRYTPVMRSLFLMQEAFPIKIKQIHVLNLNVFAEKLLTLVMKFMKRELADIFHVHADYKRLIDYIPVDVVPEEYGGNGGRIKDAIEENVKNLMANADFIAEDDIVKSDECKRIK